MYRFHSGIAAVVLALTVAGCSESAPEGPLPTQPVNTGAIDKQLEVMSQIQKNKAFTKRPAETKPAETAPAATKPGAK